jgi:hypothetical protein
VTLVVEGVVGCGVDEQGALDRTDRFEALDVALSSLDGLMRVMIIGGRVAKARGVSPSRLVGGLLCCSRPTAIVIQLAGDAAGPRGP